MTNYILHTLHDDIHAINLIRRSIDGIHYWKAELSRFADLNADSSGTYSHRLGQIVDEIELLTTSQSHHKEKAKV